MSEDRFDSEEFYDLMQEYRHCSALKQEAVCAAFEAVKQFARDGWISVRERLPEPGTECFVWVTASPWAKPGVSYAAIDNWDEQREDPLGMGGPTIATGVMWGDHEFDDVSHWMPITSPKEPQ